MASASFRFGAGGRHEVTIRTGLLGWETYTVDGDVVLRARREPAAAVREFEAHGHAIQVWLLTTPAGLQAEAFVDRELVAGNLRLCCG